MAPFSPPPQAVLDNTPGTRALMAWLDPPAPRQYLDGVAQPACQKGSDVVRGLVLPGEVAADIASAIDAWLSVGQMGTPAIPDGLDPASARIIASRLATIRPLRRPTPIVGVGESYTPPQQTLSKAEPKWKQKGHVGPGGAWATAKRKAKEKGKPAAYASAIFGRMTHKSEGILGQTHSGKSVMSLSHADNQKALGSFSTHGAAAHLAGAHPSFSSRDHYDAHVMHTAAAAKVSGKPKAMHLHLAAAHGMLGGVTGKSMRAIPLLQDAIAKARGE